MGTREFTVADVVRLVVRESYERLAEHERDLIRGDDPEALHQARVATRRLRSDLRTFAPFVDPQWTADLLADVRWLGSELGAVRDIEVQRERLRAHAALLPPGEAEAARRAVRRLDADRAAARADLRAALSGPRYEHVRNKLAAAAALPVCTGAGREAASSALRKVVRGRWKKVRRTVHDLGNHPSDEALHAVRIRAKRCRYAADASEPVIGKPARRLARAMARLQDVLGEHHDAVVASAWLAKTAHECSPGEAYALGMLAQIEREAASAARAAFSEAWRRTDTERNRGWL